MLICVNTFFNYCLEWMPICGDGWSLLEGNVICKQLGLGYALAAPQGHFNNGKSQCVPYYCKEFPFF